MVLESDGTKKYFGGAGSQWDALYSQENTFKYLFNRMVRKDLFKRYQLTFDLSGDISGADVLDIGCGTGRYSIEFAQRGARRVVGIDFAASMIEFSTQMAQKAGVDTRCEFICDNFLNLEFEDSFDIVLAIGFFDYVEHPEPIFEKVSSVTRGLFLATFPRSSFLWNVQRHVRYYWVKKCPIFYYTPERIERLYGDSFKASEFIQMNHSFLAVGRNR